MSALPYDWAPNAAALLQSRPELDGLGVLDAVEAVTAT